MRHQSPPIPDWIRHRSRPGRGTLAPARRASDNPIAMACLRLVTLLPERPSRNSPCFISCIALPTFSLAFLLYLRLEAAVGPFAAFFVARVTRDAGSAEDRLDPRRLGLVAPLRDDLVRSDARPRFEPRLGFALRLLVAINVGTASNVP